MMNTEQMEATIDAMKIIADALHITCREVGPGWAILDRINRKFNEETRIYVTGH